MKAFLLASLTFAVTQGAWAQPSVHPFPVGPTQSHRPSVGAYLPTGCNNVHLLIDGREVSVSSHQNRWTWAPDYDIDSGRHTAQIRGQFPTGGSFLQDWGFIVSGPVNLDVTRIHFSPLQVSLSAPTRHSRLFVDGKEGKLGQLLSPGRHSIRLLALGLDGTVLEKTWIQQVTGTVQTAPKPTPPANPKSTPFPTPQPRPGAFTGPRPQFQIAFPTGLTDRKVQVDNLDLTAKIDPSGTCIWQPDYDINLGPHRVQIRGRRNDGSVYERSWGFYTLSSNEADSLNSKIPSDGILRETPEMQVRPQGQTNPRPTLEAVLPAGKALQRCILAVDGKNLSPQVIVEGPRLRWSPTYDIQPGIHQAVVVGQASDGSYYYRNWTFEVP